MASSSDDTTPCHSEKCSQKNNDPTTSSWLTRCTKVSLPCDAASGHARAAHAQTQAPALPIGAAARGFVLNLGDVPLLILLRKFLIKKGGLLLRMCAQ
jgi:hypothetical protein